MGDFQAARVAPSQCVAPKTAGYVAYKANADLSTLFCITPP